MKKYLKAKIDELETKLKYIRDLYRCINDLMRGYQTRTNTVNDKTGDLIRLPLYFG
jgi:hypothetical protein